jgi:ABC-type lipoprotein export system ATPase subunit
MIEVNQISKQYRSGRGIVRALVDVSFTLESGKTLAIVGKSGSGKSTLLRVVGGLEQPDTGTVTCFGVEVCTLSGSRLSRFLREQVGFVFQYGNLLSYLTVSENIGFPLALLGKSGKEQKARVCELLESIELPETAHALPSELSGGELQRVAIARAIAHHPKLLLADEPTASLDSNTGLSLVNLMFQMGKQQDCTIMVATHDGEVLRLADTAMRLRDGGIEQQ